MDPFAIQCTTCKSRLSVKSSAAIGQIIACPKCGGMVLIKPPAAPQPSDPGDTRPDQSSPLALRARQYRPGDTLAPDAFDDIDSILNHSAPARAAPPPLPPSPAAHSPTGTGANQTTPKSAPALSSLGTRPTAPLNSAAPPVATGAPSIEGGPSPGKSAILKQAAPLAPMLTTPGAVSAAGHSVERPVAPGTPQPAASGGPHGSEPAPSPDVVAAAAPPASPPWRFGVWFTASLSLGVALAVGVVCVAVIWSNGRAAVTAGRSVGPLAPSNTGASTTPSQPAPTIPAATPQAPSKTAPTPHPSDSRPPAVPSSANLPAQPAVPQPAAPALPAPAPNTPRPATPPPDGDPLGLVEPPAAHPNPPARPALPANDPLQQFDNLLQGDAIAPPEAAAKPPSPPQTPSAGPGAPPDQPAPSPEPAVETPEVRRPEPRVVDVAARLADPLEGLEANDVPLADFLAVIQDLTGAPVTLAADSLALRNVWADRKLQFQSGPAPVGAALERALAPLKLQAVAAGGQLVVDLAPNPPGVAVSFPIADLTGGDEEQTEELVRWLTSLVAPEAWRDGAAAITEKTPQKLMLRCPVGVQAQAVLLAQKLRVARGLEPLGKTFYTQPYFQLATRTEQARRALHTPVTLNYGQPTLLTTIAQRLGRTAGVRVLIDWRSLDADGWNPAAETTLRIDKEPLEQALTKLLSPLGLTWRLIDGQTVEVLTPRDAAQRLELEFFSVGEATAADPTGAQLLSKLASDLGPGVLRSGGGPGELAFDPISKCVLAALPQAQHQRLADLLRGLRAPAAPAPMAAR